MEANSAWSGSQSPSWLAMSGDYRCQRVHSGETQYPRSSDRERAGRKIVIGAERRWRSEDRRVVPFLFHERLVARFSLRSLRDEPAG